MPPSESNRLRALQSRVLACTTGIRTSYARALPTPFLRRDRSAARPRASKAGHAFCCSTRSGYSVASAHCARCSSAKLRALRARGLRWSRRRIPLAHGSLQLVLISALIAQRGVYDLHTHGSPIVATGVKVVFFRHSKISLGTEKKCLSDSARKISTLIPFAESLAFRVHGARGRLEVVCVDM
jgi:hypothetical protein